MKAFVLLSVILTQIFLANACAFSSFRVDLTHELSSFRLVPLKDQPYNKDSGIFIPIKDANNCSSERNLPALTNGGRPPKDACLPGHIPPSGVICPTGPNNTVPPPPTPTAPTKDQAHPADPAGPKDVTPKDPTVSPEPAPSKRSDDGTKNGSDPTVPKDPVSNKPSPKPKGPDVKPPHSPLPPPKGPHSTLPNGPAPTDPLPKKDDVKRADDPTTPKGAPPNDPTIPKGVQPHDTSVPPLPVPTKGHHGKAPPSYPPPTNDGPKPTTPPPTGPAPKGPLPSKA